MRRLLALTISLLVVAIACGVPGPGEMESIDPQDVPFGLATTSTTSTTTTTTTTTIPAPTTTVRPAPTTTEAQTTTTNAATEPVDLYFVSGNRLFRISKPLVEDADASLILAALAEGPASFEVPGLRSAIPPSTPFEVDVFGGVAEVDVPRALLDEMSQENLRLMFGQIVLTLTSPRCLGQVRFTFDGEYLPVFLGDFATSEPGQDLSCSDYERLVTTASGSTDTTTTPPTAPPTTSDTTPDEVGGEPTVAP